MKMKQKIVPVLIIILGLLLLAYPFLSNYMFEKSASSTIQSYKRKADSMDQKEKKQIFLDAQKYNRDLSRAMVQLTDPFRLKQRHGEKLSYTKILDLDGPGVMGYVRIPCISIELPIYHGTSAEVLEHGIGHLAASSFPIGGKDTHSVLTGHTGLSSARLFTDLTQMKKGDLFFIRVVDRELAYRVDQITVVRPEDTRKLQIIKGEDHVTLVTCTPYGVNDHRLLVRGVRTKYDKKSDHIQQEHRGSQWMAVYKRAILIGLLIIAFLICLIKGFQKVRGKIHVKKKERREK